VADGHIRDELGLEAEDMRKLGYRTVDLLVEHLAVPPGVINWLARSEAGVGESLREAMRVRMSTL
jgi:acyl-CoA reductase-like NAD-dependent aldehyde dehydrogenase